MLKISQALPTRGELRGVPPLGSRAVAPLRAGEADKDSAAASEVREAPSREAAECLEDAGLPIAKSATPEALELANKREPTALCGRAAAELAKLAVESGG